MARINAADIDYINLQDRSTDSDVVPSTNFAHLYIKNNELYIRLDDGSVINITSTASLNDLSDVDVASTPPALGTLLAYDSANFVSLSVGTNGQILKANSGAAEGVEWADETVGTSVINDLSDVTITGPQDNEVLTYSAGTWINAAGGGGGSLDGLSDVTITSVQDDQFLRYDTGTGQWVNETYSSGAPSNSYTPTDGTDWINPDPSTVQEALDDLASRHRPYYVRAVRTGDTINDNTTLTLSPSSGDVVTNPYGMWSSGTPTWFILPEEGFYMAHLASTITSAGAYSDYYEVTVLFWDGSTNTTIGQVHHYPQGSSTGQASFSISSGVYRPAGGATMFVSFEIFNFTGATLTLDEWHASVYKVGF